MIRQIFGVVLTTLALALPLSAQEHTTTGTFVGRNDALNELMTPVAERVKASVVTVEQNGRARGFAVCVGDGVFLTASRVVTTQGSYKLITASGQSQQCTVGATDRRHGLTLLICKGLTVPVLETRSASELRVGDLIVSVGTSAEPVSAGVVGQLARCVEKAPEGGQQNFFLKLFSDDSNRGPEIDRAEVVHHDAPLLDDEFGSALVDADGRLIGINVDAPYRGSSHAVPVHCFDIDSLVAGKDLEAPQRAFLGVRIEEQANGVQLSEVIAGQAAEKAGLRAGDVIVAIDGKAVGNFSQLRSVLAGYSAGQQAKIRVLRDGAETELSLVFGAR